MNALELAKMKKLALEKQAQLNIEKSLTVDPRKTEVSKKEEGRVFFARIPHSKFIFSDGEEAIFAFGRLEISPDKVKGIYKQAQAMNQPANPNNGRPKWEVYLEELNAIVPPQGTNPMIFTQDTWGKLEELPVPEINAVDESSLLQTDASIMKNNTTNIEQSIGAVNLGEGPSNVNTTTLDGDLLKASQRSGASVLGNTNVITPVDPDKLPPSGAMSSAS